MQTIISVDGLIPVALSPAQRAEFQRRAAFTVDFGVAGAAASARFDDRRCAADFERRYRALATDADDPATTYAVSDDEQRTYFWSGDDGEAWMWAHQPLAPHDVAFLADVFATHELLSRIPHAVSLHAASLYRGGTAFALTGLSTAGKSTTALACAAIGAQLYSDERCVTTPAGTIAYPRALSVRAGGKQLLIETLPDCDLRRRLAAHPGANWPCIAYGELFGPQALPPPAPLRALFAIVGRDRTARVRRIEPAAMLAYAQPAAKTWSRGVDRVAALLALCRSVACYELVLGTPVESARHVLDVVDALDAAAA